MDKNNFSTFLRNNINDTFWDNYIELVRNEMIPYQLMALNDEIDGAPKSYCLENFKKAAITIQKINNNEKIEIYPVDRWEYKENECDKNSFLGWCFQDSDVYKWIEAVAYSLKNFKDSELEQKSDEIINLICNAQMENGYLDTLYIINDRSKIFTNLKDRHELYCFGHLAEAAVAYYESTGKDKLLNSAIKFADLICDTFNEDNLKGYPGHEIAELALVKLYNVTKNEKYLKEAEFFIYERGTKPYYFDKERGYKRNDNSLDYFYNQAHIPPIKQDEAVGHAVRGVYLYSGMADVARQTQNEELYSACERIWDNIEQKKMYITGGIGSTVDGEAFSYNYDLPNDLAYSETCASIGLIFFAKRMLEINLCSKYANVMERALYNTVLHAMSEDGKSFFYTNALEVLPKASIVDSRKRHINPTRQKWFGCACCPPNLARLISSLNDYCISSNDNNIFVHMYIGGNFSNDEAKISINSNYLTHGEVEFDITVYKPFKLALRIPDWCNEFEINKEYKPINGYAYVDIKDSTNILIKFNIEPKLVKCSNLVRANIGKVAVMRGPIVYCAEEIDNCENLQLLLIDKKSKISVNDDLSITINGFKEKVNSTLYYDFNESELENYKITLIPYYKSCNSGENEMSVYLRIKE